MSLRRLRTVLVSILAFSGMAAAAQPVVDGTVEAGEYTYTSGNWSMSWDDTYLYVGHSQSGTSQSSAVVVHLDVDPQSPPTGGTLANGSFEGPTDMRGEAVYDVSLPFRGDVRLLVGGDGSNDFMIRTGTGGWTEAALTGSSWSLSTSHTEISIRWDSLPGLSGRPGSFNWLGYRVWDIPILDDATPPANYPDSDQYPGIYNWTAEIAYFWAVTDTSAVSPSGAFATRHLNFRVTDSADTGTYTLRSAIAASNADTDSAERFITFVSVPLITLSSVLPDITRAVTVDGTTGGGVPGVSGNNTFDGLRLMNVSNTTVRGLSLQNFTNAIRISGGTSNTIAGNFIGGEDGNQIGLNIDQCDACVFGGVSTSDRNLINNNSNTAINITNSPGSIIRNNYIGVAADGATAAPNGDAIAYGMSAGLLIEGNVISGNTGGGILGDNSVVSILGNRIGVKAGDDSALGNGGTGIWVQSNATVGSVTSPNIVAYNDTGIESQAGSLIRANSVFNNTIEVSNGQPAPTVHRAAANGDANTMTVRFSVAGSAVLANTQSMQLDLYGHAGEPKQYIATSPCYAANVLNNIDWTVTGDLLGGQYVLMATAYEDTNCSNVGDGTSVPSAPVTAVARNTTTTTLTVPDNTLNNGQMMMLTATINGGYSASGTIAFTDNGTPITGCEARPITDEQAQCMATFTIDGSRSLVATYSGDSFNTASSSNSTTVTVATNTFTGTGNFTDAARWSAGAAPGVLENFLIQGTCTFDFSAPGIHYGTMTFGESGVMQWAGNHATPLRVANIFGFGALVMTNGGTVEVTGTFDAGNVLFTRGTGTIAFTGVNQTVPGTSYYNLSFTGSGATGSGTVTVFNALSVGNGASFSGNAIVHGSIANLGTLQFGQLTIPADKTVNATNSFGATTMTVAGTFVPTANVVVTGQLTGTGTVHVTGTAGQNSFGNQYSGAKTLTNLTVHYAGDAVQSVDALDYFNLTINNGGGAGIAINGTATVSGTLYFQNGPVSTAPDGLAELVVTNTSPSAVSYLSGYATGSGFSRHVAAGTNGYTFPVGITLPLTSAANATITFHDVAAPGKVTVAASHAISGDFNGSGINGSSDANVLWFMSHNLSFSTYDAALTFLSLPDGGSNPTRFVLRARHGNTWIEAPNASPAPQGIVASGIPAHTSVWLATGNQLVSEANSQVTAASASVSTGNSTAITVQLEDTGNFDMVFGGDTVALATDHGTLSTVTDNLDGTYSATLSASSVGTATVTGTVNSLSITDTATVTFTAPVVASLQLSAPSTATGGSSFTVTVTARDANGDTVTGYTGTVALTSSDGAASLPANYTFVPADNGVKTFTVTLNTAGSKTVTVTDTATASLTSTATIAVKGNTTTTVAVVPTPSTSAQTVTITATVSSSTAGTISGTVTFKSGTTVIGSGTISGGTASMITSALATGSHSITAEYGGSSTFNASTSAPVVHNVNAASFGAPPFIAATATSTSWITVSWSAVSGATGYRVYRATSITGGFALAGEFIGTSFDDIGRNANTTYLYKVSALNGSTESALSSTEAATTVVFTDAVLTGVSAKAVHVTQLQTAVNAMRAAASLSPATFSSVATGGTIRLTHLTELRTNLNAARSAIGLPVLAYTDPNPAAGTTTVKAAHVLELRGGTQ